MTGPNQEPPRPPYYTTVWPPAEIQGQHKTWILVGGVSGGYRVYESSGGGSYHLSITSIYFSEDRDSAMPNHPNTGSGIHASTNDDDGDKIHIFHANWPAGNGQLCTYGANVTPQQAQNFDAAHGAVIRAEILAVGTYLTNARGRRPESKRYLTVLRNWRKNNTVSVLGDMSSKELRQALCGLEIRQEGRIVAKRVKLGQENHWIICVGAKIIQMPTVKVLDAWPPHEVFTIGVVPLDLKSPQTIITLEYKVRSRLQGSVVDDYVIVQYDKVLYALSLSWIDERPAFDWTAQLPLVQEDTAKNVLIDTNNGDLVYVQTMKPEYGTVEDAGNCVQILRNGASLALRLHVLSPLQQAQVTAVAVGGTSYALAQDGGQDWQSCVLFSPLQAATAKTKRYSRNGGNLIILSDPVSSRSVFDRWWKGLAWLDVVKEYVNLGVSVIAYGNLEIVVMAADLIAVEAMMRGSVLRCVSDQQHYRRLTYGGRAWVLDVRTLVNRRAVVVRQIFLPPLEGQSVLVSAAVDGDTAISTIDFWFGVGEQTSCLGITGDGSQMCWLSESPYPGNLIFEGYCLPWMAVTLLEKVKPEMLVFAEAVGGVEGRASVDVDGVTYHSLAVPTTLGRLLRALNPDQNLDELLGVKLPDGGYAFFLAD